MNTINAEQFNLLLQDHRDRTLQRVWARLKTDHRALLDRHEGHTAHARIRKLIRFACGIGFALDDSLLHLSVLQLRTGFALSTDCWPVPVLTRGDLTESDRLTLFQRALFQDDAVYVMEVPAP